MAKWVLLLILAVGCWTAYEKGEPFFEEYGIVGILKATEENLLKAWDSGVNAIFAAKDNLEKNHHEWFCGKKGC